MARILLINEHFGALMAAVDKLLTGGGAKSRSLGM
jgi:hypothetical protein